MRPTPEAPLAPHSCTRAVAALFLAALVLSPSAGHAQGTARSMDIETSVRAAGMGGASAGVWWGEPGVWGNPASLAEVRGIGVVDGHTQLVPGLATDVFFDSRRVLIGGGGFGLSLMGVPDGFGKLRLDYGKTAITDSFGRVIGSFHPYERVEGVGIGFSPVRLFDRIRGRDRGGDAPLSRWFDVALGAQHKHTKVVLFPPSSGGAGTGDTWDWGVTGRISVLPAHDPTLPVHLEVSGGWSVLNANDERFEFGALFGGTAPPTRTRRIGGAVHAMLPSPWRAGDDAMLRVIVAELHPLEVGVAYDKDRVSAGGDAPFYTIEHTGLEATVFGVLTGRWGHYSDPAGQIVDDTFGYGFRLPVGPWGAVTYDHARVPQANSSGLPDVKRRAWSVWIDPLRIWRDTHAAR